MPLSKGNKKVLTPPELSGYVIPLSFTPFKLKLLTQHTIILLVLNLLRNIKLLTDAIFFYREQMAQIVRRQNFTPK